MSPNDWNGTLFCRWAVAAALCGVSLTVAAQSRPTISKTAGLSASASIPGTYSVSVVPSGGTLPSTSVSASGSAWSASMKVPAGMGSMGPVVSSTSQFPIPGDSLRKLPITTTVPLNRSTVGTSLVRFAGRTTGGPVGAAVGLYLLFQELGIKWETGADGQPVFTETAIYQWRDQAGRLFSSPQEAADFYTNYFTVTEPRPPTVSTELQVSTRDSANNIIGYWMIVRHSNGAGHVGSFGLARQAKPGAPTGETGAPVTPEAVADKINNKTDWTSSSKLPEAIHDAIKGGEEFDTAGSPTVTGPASLPGSSSNSTKQNPDGSKDVTTTTNNYKFDYSDNSIKITNNTTNVTNHYNSSGVQTGTTTTTTNEDAPTPEEETDDLCKANPDSAGCAKLGTPPESEIPKRNASITYTAEDLGMGGGSCPADIVRTINGRQVTVFSYGPGCSILSNYVRPLFLAIATLIAFFIVMPGGKPE